MSYLHINRHLASLRRASELLLFFFVVVASHTNQHRGAEQRGGHGHSLVSRTGEDFDTCDLPAIFRWIQCS